MSRDSKMGYLKIILPVAGLIFLSIYNQRPSAADTSPDQAESRANNISGDIPNTLLSEPSGNSAASPQRRSRPDSVMDDPRTGADDFVFYRRCDDVRAAGKAPIYRGEPGYRPPLDRDNDGIACEPFRGK